MVPATCGATWVWQPLYSRQVHFFPEHYTAAFLRCKPISVCRQSKLPQWQQRPRRGSSFQGGVPQLRKKKQATGASLHFREVIKRLRNFLADYNIQLVRYLGTRMLETMPLQCITATGFSRPRHQPAQARVTKAVASCQKSALGRQADHSRQQFACVVEL